MNYIESVLKKLNLTKKERIEECKRCFLKQSEKTQEEIENANTEDLEYELRVSNFPPFEEFRKAIKYELMLRSDFEINLF